MVKMGQTIRSVPYESPAEAPYGIEVMTFADLRAAAPRARRAAPQRPQFHVLCLVTGGIGHHTVDFRAHPLGPHSAVWIRPGVVHRWDGVEEIEGVLVLFRADFLPPGGAAHAAATDTLGAVTWEIAPGDRPRTELALEHLRVEYRDGTDAGPVRIELLRHLLQALILRVLPATAPGPAATGEVFERLRVAAEQHFAEHREVAWYASELGYAPRTLSRAARAATGRTAKQFLDDRVVLEAKRLLAHADLPASSIARRLGFDDTNFTKFFRRHTGTTPGAFRTAARGAG